MFFNYPNFILEIEPEDLGFSEILEELFLY